MKQIKILSHALAMKAKSFVSDSEMWAARASPYRPQCFRQLLGWWCEMQSSACGFYAVNIPTQMMYNAL
jgi:hypothetical protein